MEGGKKEAKKKEGVRKEGGGREKRTKKENASSLEMKSHTQWPNRCERVKPGV